ncbi:MAG TPA: HEAT repeat domain-containing protein [Tepidisphaeraceae bacterium]|jgi:HEAT repeat protein|nr:HEAT repeat domain-containing protein [Tepidisphaeraceae bacterium]
MPKSQSIESALSKLTTLRAAPNSPEAKAELAKALDGKSNLLAERAAKIVGEFKLADLVPNLARAFDRFMGSTGDKGCVAKAAIANALYEIGAETPEVFLTGVRHMQREAAWGGSVDVAAELRGVCALGLVRIAHREAMLHLTDLLTDTEPQARIMAARALAYSSRDEGALLLRLKLRLGDKEPEVICESLTALMKLSPQKQIPFVAEFLENPDEGIRESAALALGESRRREAFEALREQVEHHKNPEHRRPMLLAIAVTRLPEAMAYLLSQVAQADVGTGLYTLEALRIYRHDETLRTSIHNTIEKRGDSTLRNQFKALFS